MFTEANTVEQMVLDACVSLGWRFVPVPTLPRYPSAVFVGTLLRGLLRPLNFGFAAQQVRRMQQGGGG